jgi:exopolysaccharide biosynthesis polyprenyl glycosylphosphotransferase
LHAQSFADGERSQDLQPVTTSGRTIPRRFFVLLDALVLFAAFLLAYISFPAYQLLVVSAARPEASWFRAFSVPAEPGSNLPPMGDLLWVFLLIAPAALIVLGAFGNYAPLIEQSRTRVVVGALGAPFAGLALVGLILFTLKNPNWSRLFIVFFAVFGAIGLALYRSLLSEYFMSRRAAGYYARNVLVIGESSGIEWMLRYFKSRIPVADYRMFGCLFVSPRDPHLDLGEVKSLGEVQQLGHLLVHNPIHEVVAVHPTAGGDWIKQVIRDCDYFGVVLRIVPEALLFPEQRSLQVIYQSKPMHLPAVLLTPPHWNSDALFLKRVFDVLVSGVLLVLLSPVFLVIAIAIKLTTPKMTVFYDWRVVGKNGSEFVGYKFTTMVSDADHIKKNLQSRNEMQGPVFKIKDDPRVTPLGRFLRKYSLNELPQLWSVLKGDMSLVGPRPAFRHELERYEFWHKRKLSISPGITCLWQVRGRNKISDFDDWVKMDLEYIDNWSLWLDFKILFLTAWVVVRGTGS